MPTDPAQSSQLSTAMEKPSQTGNLSFNHSIHKFFVSSPATPVHAQLGSSGFTGDPVSPQYTEISFQANASSCSLTATSSALGNSAFKLVIVRPQLACPSREDMGRLIKYPYAGTGEVASWGFTFFLFP